MADVVARGSELKHVVDLFAAYAIGIIDVAVGSAYCHHLGTQLCSFLHGTPCHVSESAHRHRLAVEVETACGEHLFYKVESSVARGFGAYAGTSPFESFTCEHTLPAMGELLIHAEEISNLSCADSNVAGRHVLVRTDVSVQFGHVCLAEAHHFCV